MYNGYTIASSTVILLFFFLFLSLILMARIDPQINVRIAAEFKKKLEHAAIENGRSLNAEVVHRLEQSFTAQSARPVVRKILKVKLHKRAH
jgi:hypothetical protein